jgi:NACalpha-BTF3-like transcription factor
MKAKLYDSQTWLKQHYLINHESVEQIAKTCNVSQNTILNALRKHGLKK